MSTLSDRFLTAFHRIEQKLKEIVETNEHMSFFKLVDYARKRNAIIRKYEDDLKEFADLRNAIVHHRTSTEYVIAEPHEDIVEEIERIDHMLSKPVTIGEKFAKKVTTFQAKDTLQDALGIIHKKQFTQLPVYDGDQFVGLLTAVGITYWLAKQDKDHTISREITLEEILNYEKKKKENYRFVHANVPVHEVEDYFKEALAKGNRLEALLIVENDNSIEKLVGIVTPRDLFTIDD